MAVCITDGDLSSTISGGIVGRRNYFASVIQTANYWNIATTTDGVGSKVEHLIKYKLYDIIGKDCVAMNVNDLICVGANPIGFSNHITLSSKHKDIVPYVVKGLINYCKKSFCMLTGGETEVLKDTKFHISGSAFGMLASINSKIDGSEVQEGDYIIGIESNGLHANGWTAISENAPHLITEDILLPTELYNMDINGFKVRCLDSYVPVNITGGGFRNLERIPLNLKYDIECETKQPIFNKLKDYFTHEELYTNFNMGFGMMVIVKQRDVDTALETLGNAQVIGRVMKSDFPNVVVNGREIFKGEMEKYEEVEVEKYESSLNLMDN